MNKEESARKLIGFIAALTNRKIEKKYREEWIASFMAIKAVSVGMIQNGGEFCFGVKYEDVRVFCRPDGVSVVVICPNPIRRVLGMIAFRILCANWRPQGSTFFISCSATRIDDNRPGRYSTPFVLRSSKGKHEKCSCGSGKQSKNCCRRGIKT